MNQAIYRCPEPGTVITLFDETGKEVINPATSKSNAVFKDTGRGIDRCGIFRTSDPKVQAAVERSKAFKMGRVVRLKSADEIALESKKQKQTEFREELKNIAAKGYFKFDEVEKKNKTEISEFAEQIGVDSEGKTKGELLNEIKGVLYPGEINEGEEK